LPEGFYAGIDGVEKKQAANSAPENDVLKQQTAPAPNKEELKQQRRAEILKKIRELWRTAADEGVPDAALYKLEAALNDPDTEVARLAQQALEDLRRLKERIAAETEAVTDESYTADVENTGYDGETDTFATSETVMYAKGSEVEEYIDYSEEIDALASRIRFEPDEEKRSSAVHDLGLYRNEASVDLLTEVMMDTDTNVRYLALQSLWYSAADGLDKDGEIKSILQQTVSDSDSRIADLARQALDDLENLERQKAGETGESFSSQPDDFQNSEDNGAEETRKSFP